jgi:hypothetical protein
MAVKELLHFSNPDPPNGTMESHAYGVQAAVEWTYKLHRKFGVKYRAVENLILVFSFE